MSNFTVHIVVDEPEMGTCNIHTHGLEKFGLMNLMTLTDNPKVASYMIRSVANLMVDGEKFDPDILHWIDEDDKTSILNFTIEGTRRNYDEDSLYLDLNWYNPDWKFTELEDMNAFGSAKELIKKYKSA